MIGEWSNDSGSIQLYHGDCLDVLEGLGDEEIFSSVVTDPPYGLKFMGRGWDKGVPGSEFWGTILQVCLPGAHLLAFGGTRTFHRLACAIEDAGWEIRDCLMWVYGSGFPKSHDVSRAIDKAAGVERAVTGLARGHVDTGGVHDDDNYVWKPIYARKDEPATDAARQWAGWGTALKPAWEPIIVARKPLIGTVAANVLDHGCGAINVDGCRIGTDDDMDRGVRKTMLGRMNDDSWQPKEVLAPGHPSGRWPANLIHDGSDEVTEGMGAASRFFYCAKASKKDRTCGGEVENRHPTVKPGSLMDYLVRLVTPPDGLVLDPFMGSGSTGMAAVREGFNFVGIDSDEQSFNTARKRIECVLSEGP